MMNFSVDSTQDNSKNDGPGRRITEQVIATVAGGALLKKFMADSPPVVNKTVIKIPNNLPVVKDTAVGSLILGGCFIVGCHRVSSSLETVQGKSNLPSSPIEFGFIDLATYLVTHP